jgi:hypothetical protein
VNQLQYTFPGWPPVCMIEEACADWNLRHPNRGVSAKKTDWRKLYQVIRAFLRHQFTNYDALLNASGDRLLQMLTGYSIEFAS